MKTLQKNKYRILSTISKYSFIVIILFTLILPTVILAGGAGAPNTNDGTGGVTYPNVNDGTNSGNTIQVGGTGIENPLPGVDDVADLISKIITVVLYVGIPLITVAIIYSGFLFVAAQGNPEKIGTAKKALLFTVVGAAILLGSFVIANAIRGTVEDISSDNV